MTADPPSSYYPPAPDSYPERELTTDAATALIHALTATTNTWPLNLAGRAWIPTVHPDDPACLVLAEVDPGPGWTPTGHRILLDVQTTIMGATAWPEDAEQAAADLAEQEVPR